MTNEAEVFLPPSQQAPPQYPAVKPGEPIPVGTRPVESHRVQVPEKSKEKLEEQKVQLEPPTVPPPRPLSRPLDTMKPKG